MVHFPTAAILHPETTTDVASTPTSSVNLHSLPAEVIERVLIVSDPRDVSRYAHTCRFAHKLVYEPRDHFLWRELYLGCPFDDLRKAAPVPRPRLDVCATPVIANTDTTTSGSSNEGGSPAWRSELQRRIEAEAITGSGESLDVQKLLRVFETFLAAVDTALPFVEGEVGEDAKAMASRSDNLRWLDRVLRRTKVLHIPIPPPATPTGPNADASSTSTSSVPTKSPSSASPTPPKRERRPTKARLQATPSASDMLAAAAHQLRCRLCAYVALSHDSSFEAEGVARMATLRKASRCFVYDMRRYQPETLWGPYRVVHPSEPTGDAEQDAHAGADGDTEYSSGTDSDAESSTQPRIDVWPWGRRRPGTEEESAGRGTLVVNWEHTEHILNVVGLKLREVEHSCLGFYKKPLFTLEALRAYSAVDALESAGRAPEDWAGVTGKWRRFVCFMDYRDLYMFNYGHLSAGLHHPSFFDDPFDEALRPVELHLLLTTAAEYFADTRQLPRAPPACGAEDAGDPRFPTLYFEGHSRGPHASTASLRGTVSTLADGAVRWQFVTTYGGRMQWSAEGVQIGHVCSAAGIAGIWTGAHHQRDDPAGPFWMIKVDDELPEGVLNTLH